MGSFQQSAKMSTDSLENGEKQTHVYEDFSQAIMDYATNSMN